MILGNKTSTLKCKKNVPPWKINGLPLKIYHTKRKGSFLQPSSFRGELLNFGGGTFQKNLKKKAKFQSLIAVHEVGTHFPEDADGGKEGT